MIYPTSSPGQVIYIDENDFVLTKTCTGARPKINSYTIKVLCNYIRSFESKVMTKLNEHRNAYGNKYYLTYYKLRVIWLNNQKGNLGALFIQRISHPKFDDKEMIQVISDLEKKMPDMYVLDESTNESMNFYTEFQTFKINFNDNTFDLSNNEFYEPLKIEIGWE